jgi:predicted DNA-binding protein YlxM (UPF0122 family)
MLKENQMKAIRLYYEGKLTVQEIADQCGYKDRASIYDQLKKPEAKDYIKQLASDSLEESLDIFRINAKRLSKKLVEVADGDVNNQKVIYAQLQALNSVLEKAGLTTKNTVVIEKDNKNDESDYNELMDMLDKKKEEKE